MNWLKSGRFLPWMVLAVSLSVTYHLYENARLETLQRLQDDFDFRVREAGERIVHRMQSYEQVLHGAQGMFAASSEVKRDEFRAYISLQKLEDHFPGIQGVGFSLIVPPAQTNRHIAAVRRESSQPIFGEYTIRPAGERDIYTSIIYLEPFRDRNLRAFGYDMYSEPVRRAAMERARDNSEASISGRVQLVQETEQDVQSGFLMYMPVYKNGKPYGTVAERRANIVGWVYAPFRMKDLMHGINGERAADLGYAIHDGKEMTGKTLMYTSSDTLRGTPGNARFLRTRHLEIGGHVWTVQIHSTPAFETRIDTRKASLVAWGGIAASLMLALLAWLLVSGRARALDTAKKMNSELIESEARYRLLVELSPFCIHEIDRQGRFQSMNRAGLDMMGWEDAAKIRGLPYLSTVGAKDAERIGAELQDALKGITRHFEFTSSGDAPRHFKSCFVPLMDDSGSVSKLMGITEDITERKRMEQALFDSKDFAFSTIDALNAHICVLDEAGTILAVNQAWRDFHQANFPGHTIQDIGINYLSVCDASSGPYAEEASLMADGIRSVLAGERDIYSIEYPCHSPDEDRWFNALVTRFHSDSRHVVIAHENITERKRAEAALRESQAKLQAILDSSAVGIAWADPRGVIEYINPMFTTLFGYTSADVPNIEQWYLCAYPDPVYRKRITSIWSAEASRSLTDGTAIEPMEISVTCKDGSVKHAILMGSWAGTRLLANFSDITERKLMEEQVKRMAQYDPLTGLPNRALFSDRLQQAITAANRDKHPLALMFIDLDKFKPVNDSYGHQIGDLLLKDVATRMLDCVRESDTVARIGGDEFVIVLPIIETAQDAMVVAEKILQSLNRPFDLAGLHLGISSSIGIAIYPEHGNHETKLVKNGDTAMYQAKQSGRNNIQLYRDDMPEYTEN